MAIVLKGVIYVHLLIATFLILPSRAGNNSLIPNGTVCVCPGDEVMYTCSILGGAFTSWSGTALNCEPGGITLRHSNNFQPGKFDYCNGNITSEIVGIDGDCYISRLKIAAIDNFNSTSVDCSYELSSVGNSTIFIIPVAIYLQGPSGVMVSSVNMTEIAISWTENSLCSESIGYNVASSCSGVTCTTRRNKLQATCSNLPIATVCSFSIRSEVCGQMQTVNNAISVTLKRPQTNITSVYSPGSLSTLTKVIVTIYPEPFLSVARTGPSPVINYSFSYSDTIVSIPGCQESEVICQRSFNFICPPSAEIDVTLSASNMLGQGPATDPTTIGCTNEFVRVEYDSATSTITCNFLDERDTSIKSCSLQECDQMLASVPGQNSTVEAPNFVSLNVAFRDCYLVTASSNNFNTTVEVRTSMGTDNANTRVAIGISVGVTIVVIIVLITILVVIPVVPTVMLKCKRTPITETLELPESVPWKEVTHEEFRTTQDQKSNELIERFQLQEVPIDYVKRIEIYKDYELEELTEEVNSEFKIRIGRSFCLFKDELEDIPKERSIAFLQEIKGQCFSASNITTIKQNRNLNDRMVRLRNMFVGYVVFVESFESDEKKLKAPTSVLYEVQKTESNAEGSARGVITGGSTNDNPRGTITGGSTNGNH